MMKGMVYNSFVKEKKLLQRFIYMVKESQIKYTDSVNHENMDHNNLLMKKIMGGASLKILI